MTDYDKLKNLLTEFGIGFEEHLGGVKGETKYLLCTEGSAKIEGYTFFFASFDFDVDGKFEKMEVGE